MSKPPSTRKRLLELDAVRAVAILMLVATHLIYYFHSNLFGLENVLGTYLELFGLGTFFFLSGFVLGYNNRKFNGWSDVASFFKKRLLRIYPLYLVALAIAVGAFILLPSQSHQSLSSAGVLIYALGLQGLLAPRYVPDFYMFWFVGVILLCYLIYPLMMRYGSNNKIRLLLISGAIFALFLAMRLSFRIVDTRFFLYYFIFVSGIAASTFHVKLLLDKRRTFVGSALLLTVLMTVHVALYNHQLPSDPGYVFNAGQFGPYADISLFLVLNAIVLLFIPFVYYFASYLISLTKLVPTLLLISYASYAIFLFNPLILAGLNTIFTGIHLPVGFPRDMLLTIVGVSASCLIGYAFQRAADRTLQKLAH
jgi:Predicted acyltransferases